MLIKNIKEGIQKLDRKNYSVHQLDPKFNDLQFMRSYIYKNYMELHKFTDGSFQVIKINFDDIVKLYIDSINIYIELKNGIIYCLKGMRNNLKEIFTDFKKHDLDVSIDEQFYIIKDYKLIGQDYSTYILKGTKIFDNELYDLEEDEYEKFELEIKFEDIKEICEDHDENYHNLMLKMNNGKYLVFTSEWSDR